MPAKELTRLCILLLSFIVSSLSPPALSATDNGFDLSNSLIPRAEILHGGPPKDGIPALNNPVFVKAQHDSLDADARVIGLALNGVARAYPISILNYHEIVNDTVAGQAVAITYCPLCGTGIAYASKTAGKKLSFGVSGLLYNSDVLLYDRQSESLWSQVLSKAISGDKRGQRLVRLPASHTTWQAWFREHPRTQILAFETGYKRNYARSPYGDYEQRSATFFPVAHRDPRYHNKEWVLGIEVDGHYKAYPFSELNKVAAPDENGLTRIEDHIANKRIFIEFDIENHAARLLKASKQEAPSMLAFWFAWIAFHPETAVFTAPSADQGQ